MTKIKLITPNRVLCVQCTKRKLQLGYFFGALVFSAHLQTTSNGTLTMTVYKPEKKEHYDQSYFALLPH